ncbi:hypothetical protein BsWGS_20462 [Bradybaena similaris]
MSAIFTSTSTQFVLEHQRRRTSHAEWTTSHSDQQRRPSHQDYIDQHYPPPHCEQHKRASFDQPGSRRSSSQDRLVHQTHQHKVVLDVVSTFLAFIVTVGLIVDPGNPVASST